MPAKKKNTTAPKKEEEKKEEAKAEDTTATKRKAEDEEKKDIPEPPKKESKTEETVEKEEDAPVDKRAVLKQTIGFNTPDSTLNVIPTTGGRLLASLTDGGMQYLIAGARANVGMKAGRYMFEVKVFETLPLGDAGGWTARNRGPAPRQTVRLGFSTAGSPLVLGDSEDHVFFDADGSFGMGKTKTPGMKRGWPRDKMLAVVLNLDPKSPNANTLSLFSDGQRMSQPKPIPESLHGKALFPHVCYRNVKLQVNMGLQPVKALPFKCRSIGGAADADLVKTPNPEPKDGKYEVMLPVGFPDEGTFSWLDRYLEKNPHYVELSDRKILEWAHSSGMWKSSKGWKSSNDKPEYNFGIHDMDNHSLRNLSNTIAAVVPRNYVVMEVKANLIEDERQEILKRFSAPHFKKVAHVVMGEPSDEYKKIELEKMLEDKQEKSDNLWQAKKAEKERKKQIAERQKQLAEAKKKFEEEKKKKKAEEEKEGEEKKEGEAKEEKKEGEAKEEKKQEKDEEKKEDKEEEKKEEKKEDAKEGDEKKMEVDEAATKEEEKKDEPMEEEEEEEEETEPPKVELTEEEKKMWFRRPPVSDLLPKTLNETFASFSIPKESEGFDQIRFEWQKAEKSKEYLSKWILERKRTARIDHLMPSQWFQDTLKAWQKIYADWQAKQTAFKSTAAEAAQAEAEKKKAEKKEGEEDEEDDKPQADIFTLEDVCDVGNGEPLFKDFTFEDWALLQLRYELFLLQAAFKKDVDDPERPGIHESHFGFYYQRYYRKYLTPKGFGVETESELLKFVKDAVVFVDDILTPKATCEPDDFAMFLKLAEENRRERQRRIDAGDETARLKISPQAMQQPARQDYAGGAGGERKQWQQAPRHGGGGGWKGKGGKAGKKW